MTKKIIKCLTVDSSFNYTSKLLQPNLTKENSMKKKKTIG